MNKLVLLIIVLLSAPAFSGQDGGGSSRAPYIEKKLTVEVLYQTLEIPLWPAKIEFSYSESRFFQGQYPDVYSARFSGRPIELIDFFEIDSANSTFYYDKAPNEDGAFARPDYNEYVSIYNSIINSTNKLTQKVTPTMKHGIVKVLSIFYPSENPTKISNCRISEIESGELIFRTAQGDFSLKRVDAYKETKIDAKVCPEEIERFKKAGGK